MKIWRVVLFAVLLAGAGSLSTLALQQEDEPRAEDQSEETDGVNRDQQKPRGEGRAKWDDDGDGRLSAEEFPGPAERFEELDRNEDGFIDRDEMPHSRSRGRHGRHGGKPMERFDADGDGKISRQEFPGPDDRFDEIDGNGDGFISQEEMSQRRRERERRSQGS